MKKVSVLFVCLGNICRSPTAEGVFRQLAAQQNQVEWEIDSAGTAAHHQGERADHRSVQAAKARGYDLTSIISRQVSVKDLNHYDLILAMDKQNLKNLVSLAKQFDVPQDKIKLFLSYSKLARTDVPDPYYGGTDGFNLVIDLIEDAARELLTHYSK